MIVINMFSSANKVAGQGVGAVYTELMGLLKHDFANEFQINVNRYTRSDISHYHTIDPKFYLSTFSKKRGRKIGFVHFVPSTLDASLKLPRVARWTLDRYTLAFYKRMDELVVVNPNFIPKLEAYGINPDKVFPHNLRHLFARVYYSQEKDLVRLADILGHSSVNTTRIYTMESGENHLRQLEKMNLLIDRYNRIPLLL